VGSSARPKNHGGFGILEFGNPLIQVLETLTIFEDQIICGQGLGKLSLPLVVQAQVVNEVLGTFFLQGKATKLFERKIQHPLLLEREA